MYLSGIQTIIISKKTEQPCSAKNKKLKKQNKKQNSLWHKIKTYKNANYY